MSYKEQLYKNALNIIEKIYEQSKYDSDVDLFRSFDVMNAVNDNQFKSKEWLVKNLIPHLPEKLNKIALLGGWYGMLGCLIQQQVDVEIDSIDTDPMTKQIGNKLTEGIGNINFITEEAFEHITEYDSRYQCIINTSCEHMEREDINMINELKRKSTIVCLQSNNYHSVQSHINTYNSLEEFVDSLDLRKVFYSGTLATPNYDRYMVIGK